VGAIILASKQTLQLASLYKHYNPLIHVEEAELTI